NIARNRTNAAALLSNFGSGLFQHRLVNVSNDYACTLMRQAHADCFSDALRATHYQGYLVMKPAGNIRALYHLSLPYAVACVKDLKVYPLSRIGAYSDEPPQPCTWGCEKNRPALRGAYKVLVTGYS